MEVPDEGPCRAQLWPIVVAVYMFSLYVTNRRGTRKPEPERGGTPRDRPATGPHWATPLSPESGSSRPLSRGGGRPSRPSARLTSSAALASR